MARQPGGRRLCRLRSERADLRPAAGAGDGVGPGSKPHFHGVGLRGRGLVLVGRRPCCRSLPHGRWPGLACPQPSPVLSTESFFRTGYRANLVSQWLPALDGVVERLKHGALVADIGCGHGASTILMAQAFPKSGFIGQDYHEASIEAARRRAAEQGVKGNITFEVKAATEFD